MDAITSPQSLNVRHLEPRRTPCLFRPTGGRGASERYGTDGAMDHDRFIGQMEDRARLDSRRSAERATRATLETLGERLDAGAAGNLAAQLPSWASPSERARA